MPTDSPMLLSVVPAGVKAAVNVNRDLPPLPVEDNASSLNHSDTGYDYISSTLRSGADQSVVSSRHGFRNITRDLLLTGSTPEPQHAIVNTLEPEKYNPTNLSNNSEAMGKLYVTFTLSSKWSVTLLSLQLTYNSNDGYVNNANGTPFAVERQTTWTDLYKKQGEATKPSHHLKGMVHSQSEGSLAFRSMPGDINTSGFHPVSSKHKDIYTKSGQGVDLSLRSPTRGRPTSRTLSPVKYLDDVPEEQAFDLTPSSAKRARSPIKKMFGENGWLGRSSSMKELPTDPLRKTGLKNWGGKIKQRVEDLVRRPNIIVRSIGLSLTSKQTDDFTKLIPNPFTHTTSPVKYLITSKFPVSLDPPTQAKLYSEIELMICATANQYLMIQRREGRMSVDSLVQIMNFWRSKNRPQVIEFQFDQQTQRDLVLYNLKSFRFYGANAENPLSLNAMMLSWKSMAKEMSVRTFCTPDSVVRKHMHDCYKILEMLGAPLVTFLAFQEIQVRALATMRDEQRRRDEMESVKFGVERRWEPPVRGRSSEDKEMDAVLSEG